MNGRRSSAPTASALLLAASFVPGLSAQLTFRNWRTGWPWM